MHQLRNVFGGLQSLLNRRRSNGEIDEEIDSFFDASVDEKRRSGLTPEQAREAALAELGSRNAIKHRVWSSRWESAIDNLVQDVRVSVRALRKRPAFTAVALVSLALGIGANTAIFTLIQQLLLRNLPVRNPEQLVTLGDATNSGVAGGIDIGQFGMYPWYVTRTLQANPGPFQGIAAIGSYAPKVSVRIAQASGSPSSSPAQLASASLVSGNYFSVLGVHPLMGRTITAADDASPGGGAVAVASYHFWQHALSSDPAILGKIITINGTPFELIGVMPPDFGGLKQGLDPADLWTPTTIQAVITQHPSMLTPDSGLYFMNVFGRLSPEAAADPHARAKTQSWIDQQIHSAIRAHEGGIVSQARQQEIERETVPLIPAMHGVSYLQDVYRSSLWVLMAVVVLVLLIACANLANFLLARAATRQREIATRLALGSSRSRIARQSLIETLLLSVGGGLLGLAVAFAATRVLIAFVSEGSSWIGLNPAPNASVLCFTLGVSVLTGVLFGFGPAIAAARTSAHDSLNSASRTSVGGRGRASRWWPKSLVVGQVMLSLLLLVAAGLFLQTLRNLQRQDYGFERTFMLVAEFDPRLAGYTPIQTADLHQRLLDRLSAIPGVQSAALAGTPPISSGNWRSNISIAGYTPAPKENTNSILNRVSGRYFETAGISIVAGRAISLSDTASSLKVAVVNQALARHFFPKGNAVGHMLTIGIDTVQGPWEIVGVARDTRSGNPRSQDEEMMTYIPLAQIEPYAPPDTGKGSAAPQQKQENMDRFAGFILVRTSGDPAARIADLRAAVAAVDPNLPLLSVSTIGEEVSHMMGNDELSSSLTGIFALLALVLAAIGLYGVMSYNVAQRTNEIGVRLALGAQRQNVLWIILRETLLLLLAGVALGLPLSLIAARYVRDQLFGLKTNDPLTYAIALIVVSGVVLLSAWLPARRAARINPVDALRYE
ncbi:MAG TPA: ABC transporter permease [Terracidiphilus sp.]|nr:ABC transporter permease [Terracidiphilus sp.]